MMAKQENKDTKSSRKKLLFSYGILAVIVVACSLLILYMNETLFIANRDDPFDVTQAFAFSLAYNRLDSIKTYVSEDKWGFLDTWDSVHEAVPAGCKGWDNPSGSNATGSTSDQESNIYHYSYWIRYKCPHYSYAFFVDIKLLWTNKGWEIIDWTAICETKRANEKCYE